MGFAIVYYAEADEQILAQMMHSRDAVVSPDSVDLRYVKIKLREHFLSVSLKCHERCSYSEM